MKNSRSAFLYLYLFLILTLLAGCAATAPVVKSAETYFKEGEEFYTAGQYEDAIAQWKRVKESYYSPELTALAEIKIADAQFESESYIEAAASYEDFRKLHPTHDKAPYALYRLGLCYYNQISGIDTDQTPVRNAATMFETFLQQYPKSEYVHEVREKLADCRTKQSRYEIYVGSFYLKSEKYQAAIKRLESALREFPNSPVTDEALFHLGKAYLLAGEKAKGREAFTRLFNEHRFSKFVDEAKKVLEKSY